MPYWVYGRDSTTGEPAEMFSDAQTPEAAREQATAQGLIPERVEYTDAEHKPRMPVEDVSPADPSASRWVLADIDVPFYSVFRLVFYVFVANLLIGLPLYLLILLIRFIR